MKRINELNITINKALITEVHLSLEDEGLQIYVKGDLLTDSNKKVSEFSFSSQFYSSNKIEVPMDIHPYAREIFERMTPVIYEKLGQSFKALPKGK